MVNEGVVGFVYRAAGRNKLCKITLIGHEALASVLLDELFVSLDLLLALLLELVESVEGLDKHGVVVGRVEVIELGLLALGLLTTRANLMQLGLLFENHAIIYIGFFKLLVERALLGDKVDNSAASAALVNERVHFVGYSGDSALLVYLFAKFIHKKYDGQQFLMIFGWYGLGRMFIEGLRTDSLYSTLFGWEFRTSQVLAAVIFVITLTALVFFDIKKPTKPLYVKPAETSKKSKKK